VLPEQQRVTVPTPGVDILEASRRLGVAISTVYRDVQTAVTRKVRDGGEILNPDKRKALGVALRGVTIDAAWKVHAGDRLGSLEPSKLADFCVLTEDPVRSTPTPSLRLPSRRRGWGVPGPGRRCSCRPGGAADPADQLPVAPACRKRSTSAAVPITPLSW
jgi:hypothetical protein